MRKIILLFTIVFFVQPSLYSQQLKIGMESGVGSFEMNALKSINSSVLKGLPFSVRQTSNFPPYFYYKPAIYYQIRHWGFGLTYTFLSTGSRISGRDYSGEYTFDMLIKANSPGFTVEYCINPQNKFAVSGYLNAGRYYSNLDIKERLVLNDTLLINDKITFKSKNYYLEPGIKLNYTYNKLNFGFNFGYAIQPKETGFYLKENEKLKMQDSIGPNWSGFRIGLYVFYTI